ncbi:MAG: acetyltransferase [Caldilineales bacterium]|nr:acetyltransferase [Caldilineales bacterium]
MSLSTHPHIVIVGASGHGKVVADIVEQEGRYRVVGFVDTYKTADSDWYDLKILGSDLDLPQLVGTWNLSGAIVAIGDNWTRYQVTERIQSLVPQLGFVSACHPSAQVGRGVTIGAGTVIMAGAVINSDTTIGEGCIINTKASLDHDCILGSFSSLAPGATCGGNVTIGALSAISQGANVIHGITIGSNTVIGASALVLRDIPDFSVAFGIPARVVRKRDAGDRYL